MTTEEEARKLRDQVYGHPVSDKEWQNCRDRWIADIHWLREQTQRNNT